MKEHKKNIQDAFVLAPIVLGLALGLSGCSLWPTGDADKTPSVDPDVLAEASRRIDEARKASAAIPGDGLDQLEEITIPVAEAWLDRVFRGRYRTLRADLAIRALVQDRPVRLELEMEGNREIPMVRPDPAARTIREHLDAVAAQANWSWALDRGAVLISDIETRWFALSSQPGEYSAGLGLRNLNQGGGGVANQGMELTLNPYTEELVTQIRSVLGLGAGDAAAAAPAFVNHEDDQGEIGTPVFHSGVADPRTSVTVAPSANLLVVTARPNAMRKVEALVDRFNGDASRVVRIQLSLIEVAFEDEQKRNLALSLIRNGSGSFIQVLLGNSSQAIVEDLLGISSETIVDEGGGSVSGVYDKDGKWGGSNAVAQWLDTLGDATIALDDTVEVLNNRIASVDLTRTEKYVSKITREYEEDSNQVEIEVEFDDLRTGMVVHLQPTARADGRITLTLGFSRSALVARRPYDFGGSIEGETHVTDDFNRLLSITLRDGEPRLLASLSESETRGGKSRIPIFGRFGIPTSGDRSFREREMVMMITATVVDTSG